MSDFRIDFVSDMEHEHLMAEISYRGQRLCLINKEKGNDQMEIEFLVDLYISQKEMIMKFPLANFMAEIQLAEKELRTCL